MAHFCNTFLATVCLSLSFFSAKVVIVITKRAAHQNALLALLYYDYDLYLFIRGTSSSATGAISSASSSSSSTLMM